MKDAGTWLVVLVIAAWLAWAGIILTVVTLVIRALWKYVTT